jgi:N-acyl-D-aspartate/D-glutamate deacylase
MHDLVISGGTVVDGTGAAARTADITVADGRITGVGSFPGVGAERTVDADGLLVTPGWVDIHTHYDGQATWDDVVAPSSWHGVTTIVTGNCGVGFAPARPHRHEWLIGLMEAADLHPTFISNIERGYRVPTLPTLLHLAAGLGVTPSMLVDELELAP